MWDRKRKIILDMSLVSNLNKIYNVIANFCMWEMLYYSTPLCLRSLLNKIEKTTLNVLNALGTKTMILAKNECLLIPLWLSWFSFIFSLVFIYFFKKINNIKQSGIDINNIFLYLSVGAISFNYHKIQFQEIFQKKKFCI